MHAVIAAGNRVVVQHVAADLLRREVPEHGRRTDQAEEALLLALFGARDVAQHGILTLGGERGERGTVRGLGCRLDLVQAVGEQLPFGRRS